MSLVLVGVVLLLTTGDTLALAIIGTLLLYRLLVGNTKRSTP